MNTHEARNIKQFTQAFLRSIPVGDTTAEKKDLGSMTSTRFRPYIWTKSLRDMISSGIGCGPAALATVCGRAPSEIVQLAKDIETVPGPGTSAEVMRTILSQHGIDMVEVTMHDLCPRPGWVDTLLRSDHVLLIAMETSTTQSSWSILYNDLEFHNFEMRPFSSYDMLSHPVSQIYILTCPDWKVYSDEERIRLVNMSVSGILAQVVNLRKEEELTDFEFTRQQLEFLQVRQSKQIAKAKRVEKMIATLVEYNGVSSGTKEYRDAIELCTAAYAAIQVQRETSLQELHQIMTRIGSDLDSLKAKVGGMWPKVQLVNADDNLSLSEQASEMASARQEVTEAMAAHEVATS